MIELVINDCEVEIEIKRNGSGMSIANYQICIVGYDTFEVAGQREFSQLIKIIEDQILNAMANIDSIGGLSYA